MQFILFFLSFALNPVIVKYIPDNYARQFLSDFSIANVIFSLLFTIFFGWPTTAIRAKFWIPLIGLFMITINFLLNIQIINFYYTFFLLAADYSVTQTNQTKLIIIYRIFLIISVIPLILAFINFNQFIFLRSFICTLIVVFIIFAGYQFNPLRVKSPFKMILITFTFYSGSLALLPVIFNDNSVTSLKIWYSGTQIGLGTILKKIDYSLRSSSISYKYIFKIINIGSIILPFFIILTLKFNQINVINVSNFYTLIIYYISLFGLNQIKFIKNE